MNMCGYKAIGDIEGEGAGVGFPLCGYLAEKLK